MPRRPKRFIAISISITAMAMSTFNKVRKTQLDAEITNLKAKTDLKLDVVHLHEKHLDGITILMKNWSSNKQSLPIY